MSAGNGLWQVLAWRQKSLHKAFISKDLCRADGWAPGTPDVQDACTVLLGPLFSEMRLLQMPCSPKALFCHCLLPQRKPASGVSSRQSSGSI